MNYWLAMRYRLFVRSHWPAETNPLRILVCLGLGGLLVFAWMYISPVAAYLYSAFPDPQFQNKTALFFTLAVAVLASSFSLGYMVLECYLWLQIKIKWGYRSVASYLRKSNDQIPTRLRKMMKRIETNGANSSRTDR